jgi:hypothetical protein
MDIPRHLDRLSDDELIASLNRLVAQDNRLDAHVLAHLVEVEQRQLHLRAAFPSLFAYCTELLGFDEGAAYNRITVARLARRFPLVLEMLAAGRHHLAGLRVLGPHLTDQNHAELLEAAAGLTRRQIGELLAARFPRPDEPTRIRKRPTRHDPPAASRQRPLVDTSGHLDGRDAVTSGRADRCSRPACPPRRTPETSRPTTEPLSQDRYKVEFTASARLVDLLERVQALLRHRNPACDLPLVVEQAVELLEAKLLKERFGVGARARAAAGPSTDGPRKTTRHVPVEVRREVFARDGLRCAYIDPDTGRRCAERGVEMQHHRPFALGGDHSADNVSLYCRQHNRYAARQDFGERAIDAAIHKRRLQPSQLALAGLR